MRIAISIIGGCLLCFCGMPTPSVGQSPPPADVSPLCQTACRENDLPGCGLLVVKDGRVVAQGVGGVRRLGKDEPITLQDKFHLGSDTKAMTSLVAATLVEDEGVALQWDSTVGDVLGDQIADLNEQYRQATLEQLLSHRAGLPGKPPGVLWGKAWMHQGPPRQSRLEFAQGHLKLAPAHPPGTHYEYSNAGYTVAAVMLEQIAGESWEDLMQKRLFDVLGMKSAGFGPPGSGAEPADQPWGHRQSTPVPPGPAADNPDAIGPAGKVHANLPDLGKYLIALLRNARGEKVLVQPKTMQHLLTAQPDQQYALGWGVVNHPWAGGTAYTHSGSNTMNFLTIWLAPQRNFAVVAATNTGSAKAPAALDGLVGAMVQRYAK